MTPPSEIVIWVRFAISEPTVKVGVVLPVRPGVTLAPVKKEPAPLLVVRV